MDIHVINRMKHSAVRNYAIPGLTSYLLGAPSKDGCVRFFESEIESMEHITPHSHRFDFTCHVLSGWVENTLWVEGSVLGDGELYVASMIRPHEGGLGSYFVDDPDAMPGVYRREKNTYVEGESYGMSFEQIHSIRFSKGARVLFFEGPQVRAETYILEPWVNGKRVPTFEVKPWMFEREK